MTTPQEYGRLGRLAAERLKAETEEFFEQYRPKQIGEYVENGFKISVYDKAYAEGADYSQACKPTSRSRRHEISI